MLHTNTCWQSHAKGKIGVDTGYRMGRQVASSFDVLQLFAFHGIAQVQASGLGALFYGAQHPGDGDAGDTLLPLTENQLSSIVPCSIPLAPTCIHLF